MIAVTGAVNAVTGAVTCVTWGRDPALDVTGAVPTVIAVAGCHSPGRRPGSCPARHTGVTCPGPGHVLLATLGALGSRSLARPKLRPLCATRVATLDRVDSTCLARPRVRSKNVPRPKRPRCRANATPPTRRQDRALAGNWFINLPIASTALLRSEPDLSGWRVLPRTRGMMRGVDSEAAAKSSRAVTTEASFSGSM